MPLQTVTLHNLPPQPNPFIGRKTDIVDIVSRLQDEDCRLLTLVGPGGIGKTRLAIESIQRCDATDFEHGIYYIPLAPLNSADSIVTAIINVLGIVVGNSGTLREQLLSFLCQRNLLLVTDNFEHVLAGVDLIADILNSTPDVKILATSREMLNLSMEHVWHVRGMAYPDIDDPNDINQYDALNLFIERAIQLRRDFAPGIDQPHIIRICQRVDGLPLAIELAAGWLKTLSCRDIIQQIDRSIDILSTRAHDIMPRHRSIRAVFDHSWNLLSAAEQDVFPRLSVFRGGFTMEAAEHVADANFLTFSGLIEKSMIRRDANGRYDIHELLRQYGEEKLTQRNELTTNRQKYVKYFSQFVASRVSDLKGKRQVGSIAEIRADFNNILMAWQCARQFELIHDVNHMLEGMQIYFEILRYPPIANEMYLSMLTYLDTNNTVAARRLQHQLQIFLWYVEFRQRNTQYSLHFPDKIHRSLSLAEEYDDKLLILMCLIILSLSLKRPPQLPDTSKLLDVGAQLGPYYLGWALDQICYYFTIILNDNSQITENFLNDYLEVTQSLNDTNGIATAYSHLAQYLRFWGNIDDAQTYYRRAIDGFRKTNNIQAITVFKSLTIFMQLKKGNLEDVIQQIPEQIEQLSQLGFFVNHRFMNMIITKAEILLGNHQRAKALIDHISTLPEDIRTRTVFHILETQIMYAIVTRDYDAVRKHIRQALSVDTSVIATRLKLDFLPLAAFLYHHEQHLLKALELLALSFMHPLSTTGWMYRWKLLSELHESLQHHIDRPTYARVWDEGVALDVEDVFHQLKVYLGIHARKTSLRQPLIEPLTDREMEVLQFLGKGFTNRQIADELIIAIGTVKSHVHKICQKLGVNNRTKAVLRAKELNLL